MDGRIQQDREEFRESIKQRQLEAKAMEIRFEKKMAEQNEKMNETNNRTINRLTLNIGIIVTVFGLLETLLHHNFHSIF